MLTSHLHIWIYIHVLKIYYIFQIKYGAACIWVRASEGRLRRTTHVQGLPNLYGEWLLVDGVI